MLHMVFFLRFEYIELLCMSSVGAFDVFDSATTGLVDFAEFATGLAILYHVRHVARIFEILDYSECSFDGKCRHVVRVTSVTLKT